MLYTKGGVPFFALRTLGVADCLLGRSDRLSMSSHLTDAGKTNVWSSVPAANALASKCFV